MISASDRWLLFAAAAAASAVVVAIAVAVDEVTAIGMVRLIVVD